MKMSTVFLQIGRAAWALAPTPWGLNPILQLTGCVISGDY